MNVAISYEKEKGRNPKDVSSEKSKGYDVESDNRKIEVKGQEWAWNKLKSSFIYITQNELVKATHLYIVCDVFGTTPDLHIFEFSKIPCRAVTVEVKHVLHIARCRDYETNK
jgi:hypothetical protein